MKKLWETPKLIVLVRGQPQEIVLTSCKDTNLYGAAGTTNWYCQSVNVNCAVCFASAGS